MTFAESLKILGIEDYSDAIIHSHSKGELFHLDQYESLAELFGHQPRIFRFLFEYIVEEAKLTWKRPESVYQHMYQLMGEFYGELYHRF